MEAYLCSDLNSPQCSTKRRFYATKGKELNWSAILWSSLEGSQDRGTIKISANRAQGTFGWTSGNYLAGGRDKFECYFASTTSSGNFAYNSSHTGSFPSGFTDTQTRPTTNVITIRSCAYETRANVVIYNWEGASNVSVDLSSVLSGDV